MMFVTNSHILIRFKSDAIYILRSNGEVIHQTKDVQDILDKDNLEFVG